MPPAITRGPSFAVNQPYFFPYLGYFSLISYADVFVLYDNVEYSKQSWTNRNRILRGGEVVMITLPLRASPDSTWISNREIAREFTTQKFYRVIEGAYRKAPYWDQLKEVIQLMEVPESRGLFEFLYRNISGLCELLGIKTPLLRYSEIVPDSTRSVGEERIFSVAQALDLKRYVNLPGGQKLYSRDRFAERGLALEFLEHLPRAYTQYRPRDSEPNGSIFADRLSVLDAIANVGVTETSNLIRSGFRLV